MTSDDIQKRLGESVQNRCIKQLRILSIISSNRAHRVSIKGVSTRQMVRILLIVMSLAFIFVNPIIKDSYRCVLLFILLCQLCVWPMRAQPPSKTSTSIFRRSERKIRITSPDSIPMRIDLTERKRQVSLLMSQSLLQFLW